MSKRLVNPKAPNAPGVTSLSRRPNGQMPTDMKSDAEARAQGNVPMPNGALNRIPTKDVLRELFGDRKDY